MNDCAYCRDRDYNLPLMKTDLDFGVLGKAEQIAFVRTYDDGAYIDLQIASYGLGCKTLKKRSEKIGFCPMCGRKLD